jgi:hypothetical protein
LVGGTIDLSRMMVQTHSAARKLEGGWFRKHEGAETI